MPTDPGNSPSGRVGGGRLRLEDGCVRDCMRGHRRHLGRSRRGSGCNTSCREAIKIE